MGFTGCSQLLAFDHIASSLTVQATFRRPDQSNELMRYWAIFGGKCVAAAVLLYSILWGMNVLYTPPEHLVRWKQSAFSHDLEWTTMMFLYFLLGWGILFLIVWDQRWRCRTCGRRLRMPVSHGSYGQMLLFGRPRTEYICSYGHGTLVQPELHIGGREPQNWKPHDAENIWEELYAIEDASRKDSK
jgi:hypothetical protein